MADPTVPLEQFSDALDEIYELRRALAYEALTIRVHLDYKTFPKRRRALAEEQVERMQEAARGHASLAYANCSWLGMKAALREAGAESTLTSAQWQAERERDPS